MVDLYFADYGDWSYSNRRKTPVYETIDDYAYNIYALDYTAFDKIVNNVNNFNFGDGVTTEHYINYTVGQKTDYSYMLITEAGSHEVISRWFVLECYMQRNGQLKITLRRDVLADINQQIYYGENLFYCERGILSQTDKYIYNSENGNYNQIKVGQTLIKDISKIPWIVGYMATAKTTDNDIVVSTQEEVTDKHIITLDNVQLLPGYIYSNLSPNRLDAITEVKGANFSINVRDASNTHWYKMYNTPTPTSRYKILDATYQSSCVALEEYTVISPEMLSATASVFNNGMLKKQSTLMKAYGDYIGLLSVSEISTIAQAPMYHYKVGSKIYKATVTYNVTENFGWGLVVKGSNFYKTIRDVFNTEVVPLSKNNPQSATFVAQGDFPDNCLYVNGICSRYIITYSEVGVKSGSSTLTIKGTRRNLQDQPFSMFAIPYGSIFNSNNINVGCNEGLALQVASAISNYASGRNAFLYDIQLLPFSPILNKIDSSGNLNINNMVEDVDYTRIKSNGDNTTKGYIYWCDLSTFSFTVTNINMHPTDYKISNELEFCRLQSPNMSSSFEFSPAKNRGFDYLIVDCTYKPYQPYIHVVPNLKELYGGQYGTGVGLICSGDFSLPMTTDGWAEYMRNNVNYENMFNRQIENMEVKNSISRTMENWNIATGALGAAATGAGAGGMFGGAVGAVAGGVIGGGLSLAGGFGDKYYNEKLRKEEMDYTKDLHQMNTQNIKALPNTLTKVGSFTANNLIFPFIEYYKATEEEYEALKQKIRWYGMNVGKVGCFADFMSKNEYSYVSRAFVKGNFLRIAHDGYDDHFKNAVNEELSKGVYV